MPRQHYSSPMTAERQWRGFDATTNVFNDVNRRLCDDTVFCLDGEGFALRISYRAGKYGVCGTNALLTGITKTFVPFYSSFPEILCKIVCCLTNFCNFEF